LKIKINSRKILQALSELCGGTGKMMDITVAIDKLDKIGMEKVKEELWQKKSRQRSDWGYEKYLSITGTTNEKIGTG